MVTNEIKTVLGSVWVLLSAEIGIIQQGWYYATRMLRICCAVCLISVTPTQKKGEGGIKMVELL